MRTNLLEFLFGEAVMRETQGHDLGEQIVKLFEDADEVEGVEMVANKKPLADALKALGIDEPVETGAQWCEIHCDDDAKYHEYTRKLVDPDAMTKLAEMGWVMVKCGDSAMSNEKPDYKIGFIEIECHYTGAQTKPGKTDDLEKIRKDAQKDATTEFERKTSKDPAKGNPVELDDPGDGLGGKTTGVGKPSDGKDPEGTPKGSTKTTEGLKDWLAQKKDLATEIVRPGQSKSYRKFRAKEMIGADPERKGLRWNKPYGPAKDTAEKVKESKSTKALADALLASPVSETTMASAVPAFPSGGNPMSVNSPRSRALPRRRRQPPLVKPHGVSPTNS